MATQKLPRLGQVHAAGMTLHQRCVEVFLKFADLHAEGRLGHVERFRSGGQTFVVGNRDKVFQLSDIHAVPIRKALSRPNK